MLPGRSKIGLVLWQETGVRQAEEESGGTLSCTENRGGGVLALHLLQNISLPRITGSDHGHLQAAGPRPGPSPWPPVIIFFPLGA